MHHLKCLSTIGGPLTLVIIINFIISDANRFVVGERPPRGFCGTVELMTRSDPICRNYINGAVATRAKDNSLVYYRLQTVGDRLDNLETLTINQLLSQSLKRKLLLPKGNNNSGGNVDGGATLGSTSKPAPVSIKNKADILVNNSKKQGYNSIRTSNNSGSSNDNWLSWSKHTTKQAATSSLVDTLNSYLQEHSRCNEAITRYLCRFLYPNCHYSAKKHGTLALVRPSCRQDCILLRDTYCAQVPWSIVTGGIVEALNSTLYEHVLPIDILVEGDYDVFVKTRPSITSSSSSKTSQSNHYYWPHERSFLECDSLPLSDGGGGGGSNGNYVTTTIPGRSWPICSNAQLTGLTATITQRKRTSGEGPITNLATNSTKEIKLEQKSTTTNYYDQECRRGRGANYIGHVSQTRSGRQCQLWTSQWPHKHNSQSELMFSEMTQVDASNFCRNPGSLELLPWCYTRDPLIRWEYCDIPECN